MNDFLDVICKEKKYHIVRQKKEFPLSFLESQCSLGESTRGFISSLISRIKSNKYALIAEIKKASPSRGIIREDFNPVLLAEDYQSGGACCLSILTDIKFFQGHDRYIREVRDKVSLPILRKDFIVDPYQVIETRALGADCILLIMAALSDNQASELESYAHRVGLDVLV